MGDVNSSSPNCNRRGKLQLARSAALALAIIAFIYFEIHSCSRDAVVSPEPPGPVPDNTICAASDVFAVDRQFGCVSGNLGTLMTTVDCAETWSGSTLEAGNLNDVYFIDRSLGWVAGKDGSLHSTLDGGGSWTKNDCEGCPPDEDFYKVQFFGQSIGYLLGYRGLYRTGDAGASWRNDWLEEAPDRAALDVSFVDDRTAYLLGGRYLESDPVFLYRTGNGGEEWEPVEGSRASVLRTVMTIWFADDLTGWAGGGVIMKTVDGGASWMTQVPSATVREFFFLDSSRGFAAGGRTILRTQDGGATWVNITPPDDRIVDLRGICFSGALDGWVVGRGADEIVGDMIYKRSLLLVTADGGASWKVREFLFDYTPFASETEIAGD